MNAAASRYSLALPLICLAQNLLPGGDTALLEYQRNAILSGEWWRLWSGHFVHFSASHAFVNGAMLMMLSWMVARTYGWKMLAAIITFGPMALSLLLLCLIPDMAVYRGASALDAIMFALLLTDQLTQVRIRSAAPLVILTGAWLIKLVAEIHGGIALSSLPGSVHVAWQAHVAGMLLGIALARWIQRSGWRKHRKDITVNHGEKKWSLSLMR